MRSSARRALLTALAPTAVAGALLLASPALASETAAPTPVPAPSATPSAPAPAPTDSTDGFSWG
ncbi:hypothetical protein [Streptomyces roseolus]|uniref:hypothetical protein n=1 Tax=Streptomyces roseolus TaxID=67358 RepID=UPI0036E7C975